ncbi:putative bifunctional diguanylate cyclase/phosphodiesterase [Roseomonas sp. USHLN139]|uniref:putative bifunctional diguanylate cyclase/phosphodiesterase n=1 Tax=Roseomonas sp. USHLN139 TaxID=3081298 RepID=UPI003B02999C
MLPSDENNCGDEAGGDGGAPSILIVDDELMLAEELALGMSDSGLKSAIVNSSTAAEAYLDLHPEILVVVTDVRMPGGDGLALARRLLADRCPQAAIELVVMTGHATIEDAAAAVRAGAFDFIRKPFTLSAMIEVVQRAQQRASHRRASAIEDDQRRLELQEVTRQRDALASEDASTGIPNRAAYQARLSDVDPLRAGLILIAIDRLSLVNSAAGSGVGDAVLRLIAERISALLEPDWLLARVGDYEFGVVAGVAPSADAFVDRAEAIRRSLEMPLLVKQQRWVIVPSLGLSAGPENDGTPPEVAAYVALQHAKADGGGRSILFRQSMRSAAERRLAIERALPGAMASNELSLHFQPIYEPRGKSLLGFEALTRWCSPTLGSVRPDEFIPIAEETGSIRILGEWVMETALRYLASWNGAGRRGLYVAVNVSARQMEQDRLLQRIEAMLTELSLPGSALVVELTESVALGPGAKRFIDGLQRVGVRCALDDFGSGFSSLGNLCTLPVSIVKFDRSLLPDDGASSDRLTLFRGLTAAVQSLGLVVIAEGIEKEAQLDVVCSAGFQAAQGFLLGKPVPGIVAGQLASMFKKV